MKAVGQRRSGDRMPNSDRAVLLARSPLDTDPSELSAANASGVNTFSRPANFGTIAKGR